MPRKPKPQPFDEAYLDLVVRTEFLAARAAREGLVEYATLTGAARALRSLYDLKRAAAFAPLMTGRLLS